MKTNPVNAEKFVREQHRVSQGMPPSAAAATGLAATLCLVWMWHRSFALVENWTRLRTCWIAGIALTVASTIVIWWWRRRSLLRSAVQLDLTLAASNRLETVTALRDANDPIARAQREETERFLERNPVPSRRPLLFVFRAEVLLLALAHAFTLLCWTRPWNVIGREPESPAAVAANESKQAETATIEWKSPESETSATVLEEVPLEAEADSTTGLKEVALEVAVNGEPRLTQPLTNDELKQPGKHPIKISLYLDQLKVKDFDVISYHLRAQRQAQDKPPPTFSPVQFVQVKPMREDKSVSEGDKPDRTFNYVTALKAAQLRLMKDNFDLAHAEISRGHPDWIETNDRVAAEQGELAGRTTEVVEMMSTNHYPPEVLNLVRQSQPLMTVAAGQIKDGQNEPALPAQGKALGYLTQVEQYLRNQIALSPSPSRPKARDPFDPTNIPDLKPRPHPLAGKLDELAAEQSKLARDLSQTNAASNVTKPAQRQANIKRGVADLLNNERMEPDALKHLQAGHDQAGASQASLERNDVPAAREPAATAARELRQAANAIRQAGEKMANDKLAEALLKLARAASNARHSPQMKSDAEAHAQLAQAESEIREAAQRLAEAGRAQAEQGFTEPAARLNNFSKELEAESLQKLMNESRAQPHDAARAEALATRLDRLAEQAAQRRNPAPLSPQELARLVERMERARANLQRLASSQARPGAAEAGQAADQASQADKAGESGKQGQNDSQKSDQAQNAPPGTKPGGDQKQSGDKATDSTAKNDSGKKPDQQASAESPEPGEGPAGQSGQSGKSGEQGQNGSQPSNQARNTSPESNSSGQNQPGNEGPAGTTGKGGKGKQSGQPAIAKSEEMQQQFAEQLLDDLRQGALDSMSVEAASSDAGKLRNILGRTPGASLGLNRLPGLFKEIDPPLQGVVRSLRAELSNARRPHQLMVADFEQAPPAYRPAVADYFERLSRDYEPAKNPSSETVKP